MDIKHQTANIQTELNQLSKSQNQGGEGGKACLFNLIVYTHEPRRTQYFKDMVKIVMSQFPCRIIFIQGKPNTKENHFRVQVFTEKTPNEHKLIGEQISIEASGKDLERVYFILLPLFVPDLPIYLLWGQNPSSEQTILPHLEDFATRLIFDSEASEDLQQFSLDMLNRISKTSIQIKDMNWARIGGWREIFAQVFDSPDRLKILAEAQIVKIIYNNRASKLLLHPKTQAIYFQAWLASSLAWEFVKSKKENESQILFYSSAKGNHMVELFPQVREEFDSEELLGITVKQDGNCHCSLERTSVDQIKISSSDQFQCQVPFTLLMPNLKSGRNFMQEIFYQKTSEHYEAMLKLISLLKWS